MLDRGPAFRIVADINLDAVAVGILVVKACLRAFIDRELRYDAERLEPRVASQQFVQRPELECDVLQAVMLGALGIGGQARDFDDREAMTHFVIADESGLDERGGAAGGSVHRVLRCVNGPHAKDFLVPVDQAWQVASEQANMR